MSKKKTQMTTLALPVAADESASLGSELVKKYFYHWPLFIVGVVLATVGAYFYLKVTNPVYPILATLEFKAPTATSASLTVNQNSTEQELNPIEKPIIVENEIEVMQSKKLIYQVVNELQLWVTYTRKDGFKITDLYGRSPVKFQFLKLNGNIGSAGEKLKIVIKDNSSFLLKDTSGVDRKYSFDTPIKSSFGTWQLNATPEVDNNIGKAIEISIQDPDLVSDRYQNGIKVALENKDAPFVNLSTSDQVPQRGKDVLNSLMALYLDFAIQDKNKLAQNTLKFINFRLDSLKIELDSVETLIEQYKNSHNITDLNAQAQGFREINQDNMRELNDVQVQLEILAGLEKYANSDQNSAKLPAASGLLSDASLSSMYDKLSDLQLKHDDLIATTPEANPMFASINQQIKTTKANFKDKIQVFKTALLAKKKELSSFSKGINNSLKMVPGQDREYASLERIQVSKETIYKFLLEKREQVALRYASSVSDSEVVDDAHAGKVKWPNVPVVYLLGFVIGMVAAASVIYIRESMNDLVLSRKQIEGETGIAVLGELTYQDTDEQIVVSEGRSKFAIGEQFRVLRTNLYHLHGDVEGSRVTLFTSSVSGEGKSFVSSNLAVTLAYASRKVVILEMDLRKPKVSVNFGLSTDHLGISNYLNEEVTDLKKLIQPSGISGLDVLSSGSILPNPSELLEKEQLDILINTLRTMYDEIIIDSPPIHLVTDALVISRVTDASIYVIRQGYTHKYELEFIDEINKSERFPKLSIVFNGIKREAAGYGYGYSYGYSYYNSYYNSYSGQSKRTFFDALKEFGKRF